MTERRSDEELRAETEAWIESLDKDAHWARSAEQREHFDRQRRILSDLLASGVADTVPDRDTLAEVIRDILRQGSYAMGEPFEKLAYEWQSKRVADAVLALLMGGEKTDD